MLRGNFTYKAAFYILLTYGVLPNLKNDAFASFLRFMAELILIIKNNCDKIAG